MIHYFLLGIAIRLFLRWIQIANSKKFKQILAIFFKVFYQQKLLSDKKKYYF